VDRAPITQELLELVRHRAKLVGLRSLCKAEVHAVLAKCGVQVLMRDLLGLAGTELLDRLDRPAPYAARIASLRLLMDGLDVEINVFDDSIRGACPTKRGTPRHRRSSASARPWVQSWSLRSAT